MLFGLMLSYWINYAFYFHPGQVQWRFPIAFQAVFALYILIITPFLPDTPRWLMLHDTSPARGTGVLAKLRGKPEDDPIVQKEKSDIMSAINIESEEEGSWRALFMDGGCAANKRFFLAVGIQFMQQMSGKMIRLANFLISLAKVSLYAGINIVTYYAPTLFKESLGMSQEEALFVGCFLQVWYIIASFLTV